MLSVSQKPCGYCVGFLQCNTVASGTVSRFVPGHATTLQYGYFAAGSRSRISVINNELNCKWAKISYNVTIFGVASSLAVVVLACATHIHFNAFYVSCAGISKITDINIWCIEQRGGAVSHTRVFYHIVLIFLC